MEILKVEKPENMADYVYLTLDYAYLAGEEDNYKEMTELLKKSIDGLICMKHQCVNSILDISEIEELFFEYHDLMIELAEQGHYKWSDDVRESLSELVKTYGLNIRKRR